MEGISLRHWLLPHLRRQYHSLLSILTVGGNITQTLAAASPQERIPLSPVYPHSWQGISLRHWLLSHLRREYHSLLSIVTWGREYHSDTGCCLTSGDNTTPSCLSSLGGGNITQTLAAVSPQERIPLPPVYRHLVEGISLRHWLLFHLRREYHSLLYIVTLGREYHSDTGCCLTSGDNTTPSCLSSHSGWVSLRHFLLFHLRRKYHSLLSILTQGREYHSDTGCCLTSGDNATPSCLSSLRAGNITQTLAAASPQETIPLPPIYRHTGEGISLRHWLLPHLRREYDSLLSILTVAVNITQPLAAVSPQERIPLPPAYPHCGREYHSNTGCCLTSGENTTPSCLLSLRAGNITQTLREYHSLLSILTVAGNITQTLAAVSPQERIPLPPVYRHLGEGISLRHWLLSHLRRQYHSLLSIVTWGREYHSDTGCCLTSGENTTPSCLSSLWQGISLRQWLLSHLRREYHSLLSIVTWGREYHSDTGCCLTSGDNTTPSCLSSLGGGNITQTLAAVSPQETLPLPPVYRHLGEGISLRHWLLPHLRRQYHSLLSILTQGREHHSDTGCCLTSGENTTPSCLSSLRAENIIQTLAAASPQERIPLPPIYHHTGEGISLRHWLLPHLRREYDSLLSILTVAGNITQTLAAVSPQERITLPPAYPHCGREYHSNTGCCLTSGENTTPSCLSSLRAGNITQTLREYHSLLSILTVAGNITQTLAAASPQGKIPLPPVYRHSGEGISLAAASPQETIPRPPVYPHSGQGISLRHLLLPHLNGANTTPSCLSSLGGGNITQTLAVASPK